MALRRPSSLLHLRRYFSSLRCSPASPSPSSSWSSSISTRMAASRAAETLVREHLRPNEELCRNLLLAMLNPCRSLASPSTPGGRRNFAGSEEDDSEGASGGYGSSDFDEEDEDFATGEEGFDSEEDFGSEEEDYESEEEEEEEEEAQQVPPKRPSKGPSSR